MPIYEYQCQRCESHFEVRQSVSDAAPSICEKCGGRLEKKWSLSGFQFKGEGWYVTDYAKKKSGPAETSEKSSCGASAGKNQKSAPAESTAKNEPASNQKSETSSVAKGEKTSKKE